MSKAKAISFQFVRLTPKHDLVTFSCSAGRRAKHYTMLLSPEGTEELAALALEPGAAMPEDWYEDCMEIFTDHHAQSSYNKAK